MTRTWRVAFLIKDRSFTTEEKLSLYFRNLIDYCYYHYHYHYHSHSHSHSHYYYHITNMSNIEDNHFVLNRNENEAKLYFKYWLEYVYLAKISSFTETNVTAKTATAAYLTESSAAMDECVGNKRHSAKLTHVQKKFGTIKKVSIAINNYLNCVININDDAKCGS